MAVPADEVEAINAGGGMSVKVVPSSGGDSGDHGHREYADCLTHDDREDRLGARRKRSTPHKNFASAIRVMPDGRAKGNW